MLCSQQVENYSIVLCLFRGLTYNISLLQKQHIMPDTLTFTSVHNIPGTHASAAFTSKTSEVFKEEHNIAPIIINDKMKYIPWGGDNQMPYNIIDLIESGETMSTCQMFNAEVCYGNGLVYNTELATAQVKAQVDDFVLDNDLASYCKVAHLGATAEGIVKQTTLYDNLAKKFA